MSGTAKEKNQNLPVSCTTGNYCGVYVAILKWITSGSNIETRQSSAGCGQGQASRKSETNMNFDNYDSCCKIKSSPFILISYIHQRVRTYSSYYYYSVVCLTTGPKPPPKRYLHIVRSKASSFKWQYPLLSLRSSSSFLRLLPHRVWWHHGIMDNID